MIPLITLEEHFASKAISEGPKYSKIYGQFPFLPMHKLRDFEEYRLPAMDSGHVSLQIVSHVFACASPEEVRSTNDELHSQCQKHPNRFRGFATLPMLYTSEAVAELERCVKELGFVGALIDHHADGQYYDDPKFWPIFAKAEELDVPIYIHPALPDPSQAARYQGEHFLAGKAAETALSASSWGWHADDGLAILRMVAAGFFDKHPKIKIIIGHMGEMLPFMKERIAWLCGRGWGKTLKRDWSTIWDENIYITTSGMFSLNPLKCLLGNTKVENILYSIDWPFSQNEEGAKFIEDIQKSGLLKEEEIEMIAYKNAERILKVRAVQ